MGSTFDQLSIEATTTAATTQAPAPKVKKRTTRRGIADAYQPTAQQRREAIAALSSAENAPKLPDDRIGCVVWWSADAVAVKAWRLRAALQAVDDARWSDANGKPIGPSFADLVPQPVGVSQAARRAISRRQHGLPDGLRWYDVGDDKQGATVIALGEEDADAAGRQWAARQRRTIVFHPDGRIEHPVLASIPHDEANAIAMLLERFYLERDHLTATDVGQILVDTMMRKLQGVRVKAGGGVYFIPRPNDETIDLLAAAFDSAGIALRRLPAGREMAPAFRGDVGASLVEDIERLTAEANAALAKAKETEMDDNDKRKPKQSAQHKRLESLDAIVARAVAYKALLGSLAVDVDAATKAAREATKATLSVLTGGLV